MVSVWSWVHPFAFKIRNSWTEKADTTSTLRKDMKERSKQFRRDLSLQIKQVVMLF